MLSIHKILVPIVLPETSRHIAHQAAWLARRFHAEIILLHVVGFSYPPGCGERTQVTARDLHAHIVQRAEKDLDQALRPELMELRSHVAARGRPAHEIVTTARERNVDLIVMSTHDYGGILPLSARLSDSEGNARNRLPGLDRRSRRRGPAGEFRSAASSVGGLERAQLPHRRGRRDGRGGHATLRSSTSRPALRSRSRRIPRRPRVEGEDRRLRCRRDRQLQLAVGTKAEVIIDSGKVPELLNLVAERTKADVLVIGHIPGRAIWGTTVTAMGSFERRKSRCSASEGSSVQSPNEKAHTLDRRKLEDVQGSRRNHVLLRALSAVGRRSAHSGVFEKRR